MPKAIYVSSANRELGSLRTALLLRGRRLRSLCIRRTVGFCAGVKLGLCFSDAQQDPDHYTELARIPTAKAARTGFFSPELARLFVALKKQGSTPATIRIYEALP